MKTRIIKGFVATVAVVVILAGFDGAAATAQEGSPLAGVWAATESSATGTMYTELVLQANGEYTATSVSGGGAYRITSWGHWRLHGNYLRFYVRDYSPREFQGNPIYYPGTWGMTLTGFNGNAFQTSDGVTYYRKG
jgi:hypothetical protein